MSSLPPVVQTTLPKETIYQHSEHYFSAILQAIETASFDIAMEAYIFDTGPIARELSSALIRAAQRGVNVRLMVDGVGIDSNFVSLAQDMKAQGVQVRIFNPLPWHVKDWQFARIQVKGFGRIWHFIRSINRRNHRKLLIIDNRRIWLGSINISQKHALAIHHGEAWRDTAICVEQVNLGAAKQAFDIIWHNANRQQQRRVAKQLLSSAFRFNFTHRLRRTQRQQWLRKLQGAQHRVWLSNAYFVPDNRLLRGLISAAKNGLDVRLLLSAKSDVFFMPWVAAYFYQALLKAGVRIYEYQPTILHAKTVLIDDWATIGSSNLNHRSMVQDLEIDYHLQCQASITQLERGFTQDLAASIELEAADLIRQKLWQRWLGALCLIILRPWL